MVILMKRKKSKKETKAEEKETEEKDIEKGTKKDIKAVLEENKIIVWDDYENVYEPGYYGKIMDGYLELAFVEALLLLKRGRIKVFEGKKELNFKKLFEKACALDRRLPERYRVYEELRERGLLVRTGFKFGCDFRVYDRGVQLRKGPKSQKEHTKWIVFAVPEDYTCSFQELSRAVRLAHNIRAKMLWAIVDNENDITYYQVTRHKP